MSLRISDLAPLILLVACEKAESWTKTAAGGRAIPAADARLDCAVAGAEGFSRTCSLDHQDPPRGLLLTVRHPDGGFRRLLVTKDGRGVIAADGAEPAKVTIVGNGEIEVAIARDRYRLPATVREGTARRR